MVSTMGYNRIVLVEANVTAGEHTLRSIEARLTLESAVLAQGVQAVCASSTMCSTAPCLWRLPLIARERSLCAERASTMSI